MARYNKRLAQALLFLLTVTEILTTCAEVIFDPKDDYCTGCRSFSHCQQQQSYSRLRSPR